MSSTMIRSLFTTTLVLLTTAVAVSACSSSDDDFNRRNKGDGDGTETPGDPTQPGTCQVGTPHVDFANHDFVADRKEGALGGDRRRIKPASALKTEFARVFGQAPAALDPSAFGEPPVRWYAEPQAGAVSLNTTYNLAFTACYDSMTDAKYSTAPTADTQRAECVTRTRKMWNRTATPAELDDCVAVSMTDVANLADAKARWAHACASVATATGFTTY